VAPTKSPGPSGSPGEDGYLTIHGLRHHYIRWGETGADPLVLIHGLMNNARYWERIASRFLPGYCVLAPDLRGHGESEHARGAYLVWAFALDLRAFVEELDLEAFDLVAHGIGGRVAMAYARDHSHRLKHLVLVELSPATAEAAAPSPGRVGEAQVAFVSEAEALDHYAALYPGEPPDFLQRQLAAALAPDERTGMLTFRFDPALHEAAGKGAIVEVPYLWEALERITCPTLIIRATKSRALSAKVARQMVEPLPRGRLLEIASLGDDLPLRQPQAFVSAVREFLRE
jgi:pimeloyl-ACP methyl ester carboxylesterase